jgi:hypothetical protein
MKHLIVFLTIIFYCQLLPAQILHPADWTYEASKTEVAIGDEIELIFKAKIDGDWYLYSSDFDPDLGPMRTEFTFEPHDGYELVGDIKPINPKEKYDEIWEGKVRYFKGTGEFRQTVKIIGNSPVIAGSYAYQVCSDVDGKCILLKRSLFLIT